VTTHWTARRIGLVLTAGGCFMFFAAAIFLVLGRAQPPVKHIVASGQVSTVAPRESADDAAIWGTGTDLDASSVRCTVPDGPKGPVATVEPAGDAKTREQDGVTWTLIGLWEPRGLFGNPTVSCSGGGLARFGIAKTTALPDSGELVFLAAVAGVIGLAIGIPLILTGRRSQR
jgi:hypothetical protein